MKSRFLLPLVFFALISLKASSQNFAWAKQTGTASSSPYSNLLAIDDAGNVYTSGSFSGTVDFDPGASVYNMTCAGYRAFYVTKLDNNGNFIWARQIGGASSSAISQAICVGVDGNVYTTGYFFGSPDFDPGTGVFTLNSVGVNSDIFISKLDSAGNFLWAGQVGGVSFETGLAITTDAQYIYFTGYFSGTADFNPGPGVYNLVPVGGSNSFACKLDMAGNLVWAKHLGRGGNTVSTTCRGNSIAVDGNGNVYTTGAFADSADFDPDTSSYNFITTSSTDLDIYLSKLDSVGNFVYAKQMGGNPSGDEAYSLFVDSAENVFITGNFGDTADFDPGAGAYNLIAAGANDIFVAKYDAGGNFVWAKGMGGLYNDFGISLDLDNVGNVYPTGNFGGPADFDPGSSTYTMTPSGNADVFISKLDNSGNFVWAKQIGSANNDYCYSIVVDGASNIYLSGEFFGTCDFDPGVGAYNLTAAGGYDDFTVKLGTASTGLTLNQPEPFSVHIYPGLSQGQVTISCSEIIEELIITNVAGQTILETNAKSKEASFILNTAGIYFVLLKSGNETVTRKVIIN